MDDRLGCSHMTKGKHVLTNFQGFDEPKNVALEDGRVLKAMGSLCVQMNILFSGTETKKTDLYVLCVPKLTCSLFSVRAVVAKETLLTLTLIIVVSWDGNGKLRGMGSLANKLYQLDCQVLSTRYASVDETNRKLGSLKSPKGTSQ